VRDFAQTAHHFVRGGGAYTVRFQSFVETLKGCINKTHRNKKIDFYFKQE
jgi:hypothetical protein